jgi:Fe-S cluster assembly iron-binding protein IscA
MITLSMTALRKVQQLRTAHSVPGDLHLRIKVVDLYFDRSQPDDHIVPLGGLNILIDPMSEAYLGGTVVDHTATGFVFQNPQAAVHCKCGASFRTFVT